MRVGPVGWAFTSEEEVLHQARLSAAITHDHPEGIKGVQATALAIYLAWTRTDKATIRARVQADFGYELARTVDAIRPGHAFDVSCQGTVPEALIAFLDAESYEDRSATPYRWAATAIPWPALPVASPRPFMAASPSRSARKSGRA